MGRCNGNVNALNESVERVFGFLRKPWRKPHQQPIDNTKGLRTDNEQNDSGVEKKGEKAGPPQTTSHRNPVQDRCPEGRTPGVSDLGKGDHPQCDHEVHEEPESVQ